MAIKLFHHTKEVEGKTIQGALDSFLTFLCKCQKKVLLVGHNIQLFDSGFIQRTELMWQNGRFFQSSRQAVQA